MVQKCIVLGCSSNYTSRIFHKNKVTTFNLPKDKWIRQKWLKILQRPDLLHNISFPSNYGVCIKHFSRKTFEIIDNKICLKKNSFNYMFKCHYYKYNRHMRKPKYRNLQNNLLNQNSKSNNRPGSLNCTQPPDSPATSNENNFIQEAADKNDYSFQFSTPKIDDDDIIVLSDNESSTTKRSTNIVESDSHVSTSRMNIFEIFGTTTKNNFISPLKCTIDISDDVSSTISSTPTSPMCGSEDGVHSLSNPSAFEEAGSITQNTCVEKFPESHNSISQPTIPNKVPRVTATVLGGKTDKSLYYRCDLCHLEIDRYIRLSNHRLTHTRKPNTSSTCFYCNDCFSKESSLRNHLRHVHLEKSPFRCRRCLSKFTSAIKLRRHRYTCSGRFHYQCTFCFQLFELFSDLTDHEVDHYQCLFCSKTYNSIFALEAHEKLHIEKFDQQSGDISNCDTNDIKFSAVKDMKQEPNTANSAGFTVVEQYPEIKRSNSQELSSMDHSNSLPYNKQENKEECYFYPPPQVITQITTPSLPKLTQSVSTIPMSLSLQQPITSQQQIIAQPQFISQPQIIAQSQMISQPQIQENISVVSPNSQMSYVILAADPVTGEISLLKANIPQPINTNAVAPLTIIQQQQQQYLKPQQNNSAIDNIPTIQQQQPLLQQQKNNIASDKIPIIKHTFTRPQQKAQIQSSPLPVPDINAPCQYCMYDSDKEVKMFANHMCPLKLSKDYKQTLPKVDKVTNSRNEPRFKCKQCNKIFKYKFLLFYHMKTDHPGTTEDTNKINEFGTTPTNRAHPHSVNMQCVEPADKKDTTCKGCKYDFVSFEELVRHHCPATSTNRSYKICRFCGKSLTKSNIQGHEDLHLGIRRFKCDECEGKFSNISSMLRHVRTIHKTFYRCMTCKVKMFVKVENYQQHLSLAHHCPEEDIIKLIKQQDEAMQQSVNTESVIDLTEDD